MTGPGRGERDLPKEVHEAIWDATDFYEPTTDRLREVVLAALASARREGREEERERLAALFDADDIHETWRSSEVADVIRAPPARPGEEPR